MKFLVKPKIVMKVFPICGVQNGNGCGNQCDRCGQDCTLRF